MIAIGDLEYDRQDRGRVLESEDARGVAGPTDDTVRAHVGTDFERDVELARAWRRARRGARRWA